MIRRGNHSCERSCSITLPSGEFTVTYRIAGKCYSDSGRLSGPPENCYPPESGADITECVPVEVLNEEGEVIHPSAGLTTALIAEVQKLPLDDYLLESWAEAGYE